jgi:hypothetical protein
MGVPPYPPYPATTIAAWFISQAKAGQVEPSGLQLHKLVGRAQGHYRARYGRPLLAEPMPAWPPGRPVAPDGHAVAAAGVSPAATASFLGEVWDSYGGCFAEVKLVIPATRRRLPVGGAA